MFGYGTNASTSGLVGYANSDYDGDLIKRKLLTYYIFTLYDFVISWKATLQQIIAMSIAEAEYMSLAKGAKGGIWLNGFIHNLGLEVQKLMIYSYNQSVIDLAKNPIYYERTKHIDIRLNFIRDINDERKFTVEKIAKKHNPTDMLTKSLLVEKFKHSLDLANIRVA